MELSLPTQMLGNNKLSIQTTGNYLDVYISACKMSFFANDPWKQSCQQLRMKQNLVVLQPGINDEYRSLTCPVSQFNLSAGFSVGPPQIHQVLSAACRPPSGIHSAPDRPGLNLGTKEASNMFRDSSTFRQLVKQISLHPNSFHFWVCVTPQLLCVGRHGIGEIPSTANL